MRRRRTRISGNGKKIGRPSPYDIPHHKYEVAYHLALLGATDEDLAKAFDVSTVTINAWKKERPEFLNALKEGKEIADAKVAASLYQRAVGYSHPDTHISIYKGDVIETEVIKHYPPDTTACIFWLKNRQKGKWRDVHRVEGDVRHDHRHVVLDLSSLSREELIMARKLGLAQQERKLGNDNGDIPEDAPAS